MLIITYLLERIVQSDHVEWKAVQCIVERIFFNPAFLAYMYVCVFLLSWKDL